MKKLLLSLALAAAALHTPALAQSAGQALSLQVDGRDLPVANLAARLLGAEQRNAPHLVEDITDGKGPQKVPGYKMQVMARTYSTLAETRPPREGQPSARWGDVMHIHRGVKVVFGIPVRDGRMHPAEARLLGMAVVSDAHAPAFNPETDKMRPRGKQLVRKESAVTAPELKIAEFALPEFRNGRALGGHIKLQAAATVDGQRVQTSLDGAFDQFQVTTPEAARIFTADPRFAPAQ